MIAVIDYGIGNLRSAEKALLRVGADARLVSDPDRLGQPAGVVIPGVGAYGSTVTAFREAGFEAPIREMISAGVPTLGICVGMQMLYEGSEESPDIEGLALLPGTVRRLRGAVRLPQMQWNRIQINHSGDVRLFSGLTENDFVYFVHSYAVDVGPETTSTCTYGVDFSASVGRGNLFGVQFHPEKSSDVGLRILGNFSELCNSVLRS